MSPAHSFSVPRDLSAFNCRVWLMYIARATVGNDALHFWSDRSQEFQVAAKKRAEAPTVGWVP